MWWGVITFIVHEHMFDATQQLRFLLGCFVPCTCQRVQCYAAAAFLAGTFTFLAHEHMLNATPPIEGTKEKRLKQLGNLARHTE